MREMSQVIVYYDETWKIKDLDGNYATQHLLGYEVEVIDNEGL